MPTTYERVLKYQRSLPSLAGCQRVSVLPYEFSEAQPPTGITYDAYRDVAAGNASYSALLARHSSYEYVMQGHPSFPGGLPARPGGYGLIFGVTDQYQVEWWLTDAEGLADSAVWEPVLVSPALGDGQWVLDVHGKPREVILRGHVMGVTRGETIKSVSEALSVLSTPPRTGWLSWEAPGYTRRLPVVMNGQAKTTWRSKTWCEVEVSVIGVDVGTPGKGVFMESEFTVSTSLLNNIPHIMDIAGTVPTPPVLHLYGPMAAGATVQIGDYKLTLNSVLNQGDVLKVDCSLNKVWYNSASARHMVSFDGNVWPLLPVGAATVEANFTGGKVFIEATYLW